MVSIARILVVTVGLIAMIALPARSGDRDFRLAVPTDLENSGFLKHLLPRFSLKMQTRITLVAPGETAEAILGHKGEPVFDGLGRQWKLDAKQPDHPGVKRFADWIGSEVGLRTITAFKGDDGAGFTAPTQEVVHEVELSFDGDPAKGLEVSQQHCRRCHAVTQEGRINSIGSTPSFFVLRSLPDWSERFERFYALNPHPAFTQVDAVTPPFPQDRPSPIVPVEMTLDDLEAIVAYVAGLTPADLGKPIQHQ
ncbi:hypothetical protein RXV86_18325 [Alisedimentitalea sp. MJ-SS2]|uniref:hypothetical protein n=1 Tax=Aliisedimentitalea sp. MJ-SS2 TaxID=3049795 RepID=UPI00290CEBC5|nr:hypothetical protein [Alisedimentitalea sp. MJ-SS2]MDU8929354.1 hypothetical protein [Alisedimentitalea sp. MJ-SS2]